ncbi:MAG: OsmC family protein [Thermoanaerobaculia bacterium]
MTTVTAQLRSGMQTTISARQFTWLSDEPPAGGGSDQGPTPYEILVGSLAACTAITLRWYANHTRIELEGVDVALEFDRVHADDCAECEQETGGLIERIRSRVTIRGSFDEAQRARLTQIAGRCPVHKTLTHGVQIFDSVSFEQPEAG